MRVGGALDLGDLDQRLVSQPPLGVGLVDGIAFPVGQLEHPSVRTVGVVGDRQRLDAPRALLVHPVPELLRVVPGVHATERNARHVRVTEDHVSMQVFPSGTGGSELVGDEGGESAWIVVALCGRDDLPPCAPYDAEIEQVVRIDVSSLTRQHFPENGDAIVGGFGAPEGDRQRMPANAGIGVVHLLEHAQVGGMVGDREEVERGLEAHLDSGCVGQRFALGVPVGVVRIVAGAVDVGVEGVLRVDVKVAEVGVSSR